MGEKHTRDRHITGQRMTGVILHPLAEVGVGMFVPVVIGGRQLVVDLKRGGERRHRQQQCHQQQCNARPECACSVSRNHECPRSPGTIL